MNHMMYMPLMISDAIVHAGRHHGRTEIVTRCVEGGLHRYTYRDCERRSRQLASVLGKLDIKFGDRVGTLAWNTYRHLEIYFGTSGSGAVCHTVNPRLHLDQIAYIVNHANDRVVFFDLTFLPLVEQLAQHCPGVEKWVALAERAAMPSSPKLDLLCYEDLMASVAPISTWPTFDERSPSALCYTSGSTGNPKGVMYTHRSTLLHCYAAAMPDSLNCSAKDVIMPVVPMFHVNAWGFPYIAAMVGAKLVLPGPNNDSESLYALLEEERVTFAAGVPTVWIDMLRYVEDTGAKFSSLRRIVIGGATTPPVLRESCRIAGIHAFPAWGMTETSPVGTCGTLLARHQDLLEEARERVLDKQGRALFGIDMKISAGKGTEQSWDGESCGELMVRGHWVVGEYFGQADSALENGWFPTGDVATIDADGYLQITDRLKDVIKSGGEWISSIDIENIAASHPGVSMAACVSLPHPKWGERPVVFVVRRPESNVSRDEMLSFYTGRIAKWSIPDDVIFIDAMPINATGKIQKMRLREMLAERGVKAACVD